MDGGAALSNLIGMTLGATADYWWDRLAGHPDRWRFVLTKRIEEWAYRAISRPDAKTPIAAARPVPRTRICRSELPETPRVVVIVAALIASQSRSQMLERLLNRLTEQSYRQPFDIVVIDDASPTRVHHDHATVLRNERRRGPAASRNRGIEWAVERGADLLFMTDSDCLPDPTWIETGVRHFRDNPYSHLVAGSTLSLGETWFDRYHEINGTLNGRCFQGTRRLLYGPTCNLALRRLVFDEVRFDETYPDAACEDIDFCCKCADAGFLILYNREMRIRHDFGYGRWRPIHNVKKFVQQFQRYARAEKILLSRVPDYFERLARTEALAAS